MGIVTFIAGLLLPCLLGVAVLAAIRDTKRALAAPGEIAWIVGAGYLAGAFLLTLWMRVLSLAGIPFGAAVIGLPLAARDCRARLRRCRGATAGSRPWPRSGARCVRWPRHRTSTAATRLAWRLFVAWMAIRYASLALEVSWQPLYPWDAWIQWATKARVWYEKGAITPFARTAAWFAAGGSVWFDASPEYPPTVPLLQVWTCIALGRWDDALMNWPWWQFSVALTLAIYGALREQEVPALPALIGAFLVASLPLANVHVALAGYADLPMAAYYTGAVLAFLRWVRSRSPRDAAVALLLAAACTQIKIPGLAWALTIVPGVVVALWPRRGPRYVLIGFAVALFVLAVLAQTSPVILGYRLHLDFDPAWRALAGDALPARQLASALVRGARDGAPCLAATRIAEAGALDRGRRHGRAIPDRGLQLHRCAALGHRSDDDQSRDAARGTSRRGLRGARVPRFRRALRGRASAAERATSGVRRGEPRGPTRAVAPRALLPMLELPGVTLLCADTANHALALRALAKSMEQARFGRAMFLTDALPEGVVAPAGVEITTIPPIVSRDAYSELVLKGLRPFVDTPHALVIQWDGYVVNADAWDPSFLDCDYIGAKWYWHDAGSRVGNGGFSLRSRKLLVALEDPRISLVDVEDTTIGRTFRPLLEREHGIRFADEAQADRFSFEAAYPIGRPFGFHGLFNFCRTVPSAEIALLAPTFSDAIARSPQLLSLLRNCVALGQWDAVRAIGARILATTPANAEVAAIVAGAEGTASQVPVAGRNDPCPCGSGKRYKHCHGAFGATGAATEVAGPDVLVRDAMTAHQQGDLDAAERGYRAALALAPGHPMATHFLGVSLYQRKRVSDALPLLEAAVAAVPEEAEFHNNLGLALAAADRFDEAIAAHRRALALRAGARDRMEQSRTRAAGGKPPARGDRRLPASGRARSRLRAGALESRARAPRAPGIRGGLARIRVAPPGAGVRAARAVVARAALGRRGPRRAHATGYIGARAGRHASVHPTRATDRGARGAGHCERRSAARPVACDRAGRGRRLRSGRQTTRVRCAGFAARPRRHAAADPLVDTGDRAIPCRGRGAARNRGEHAR